MKRIASLIHWQSMDRKGIYRALRYLSVGISTFLLDLCIVLLLTQAWHLNYLYAVAIGFIIGVSGNYAISRLWVFKGSGRSVHHGYLYFAGAGLTSLAAILTLVGLLVGGFRVPLIPARILVSGAIGCANYLFNLHLNFKVAGKHVS